MTKGFTLIEILVVASITVFITGILVANFSRSRVDLNQAALVMTDAIREAQALALAGSTVSGTPRCGYGIHFLTNGYVVYAGPNANAPTDCSSEDRNFGTDDVNIRETLFSNNILEIVLPAPDIFFEPPDPTTYINNVTTPPTQTTITIRRKGATCTGQSPADCRKINVSTSGLIQSQ